MEERIEDCESERAEDFEEECGRKDLRKREFRSVKEMTEDCGKHKREE